MKACFSGHLSTAQYLVEKGADIHLKSAIHENTAIFYAAISGEVEVVKFLYEKGAELNLQNKEGETPLMKAADFGHAHIVEYLIRMGADVFKTTLVSVGDKLFCKSEYFYFAKLVGAFICFFREEK